jgi:hypothetical protein
VIGNHDEEIRVLRKRGIAFPDPAWHQCSYQAGLAHAAMCLDTEQAEWLARLPHAIKIPARI